MEPGITGAIIGATILTLAFGGALAVVVWLALSTVKGFRSNRPEPMAWLLAMAPNHEALPTPARQAPILPAGALGSGRNLMICAAQASAIAGLIWVFAQAAEEKGQPVNYGAALLLSIIITAFMTAVVTRLWDRANLKTKRAAFVAVPAPVSARAEHHEAVQERDRVSARLGVREIRKTPSSLWRGQQRG